MIKKLSIYMIFILFISYCTIPLAYGYEKNKNNCKIICHRGLSSSVPENTLPSFEACVGNSIYGIECDVYESADNEFVIIHDDTVDRMTDGTGKIIDMTWEEIKNLNIDMGANIKKYKNLKIPLLREYLKVCKKNNKVPVIEIKNIKENSLERFYRIIKEEKLNNKAIIISQNKKKLSVLRKKFPEIEIQWLCIMNKENIDFCSKWKFDIDVELATFNKELLSYAHDKNVKVNVWTVDDLKLIRNLERYKVDFITTNGGLN